MSHRKVIGSVEPTVRLKTPLVWADATSPIVTRRTLVVGSMLVSIAPLVVKKNLCSVCEPTVSTGNGAGKVFSRLTVRARARSVADVLMKWFMVFQMGLFQGQE